MPAVDPASQKFECVNLLAVATPPLPLISSIPFPPFGSHIPTCALPFLRPSPHQIMRVEFQLACAGVRVCGELLEPNWQLI